MGEGAVLILGPVLVSSIWMPMEKKQKLWVEEEGALLTRTSVSRDALVTEKDAEERGSLPPARSQLGSGPEAIRVGSVASGGGPAGIEWDAPNTGVSAHEEAMPDAAVATMVGDHMLRPLPKTKVFHEGWGSEETYHALADMNCSVLTGWWGPGKLRWHGVYCLILIVNYLRNKLLQCFHILQELNDYSQLQPSIVHDLSWYT